MDTKRIIRIDPSSITISDCSERFRLMNLEGLTSKRPDHKMDYGTGLHKGIAEFLKTGDPIKGLTVLNDHMIFSKSDIPESDFRTPGHCSESYLAYIEKYAVGDSFTVARVQDKVGVELAFMLPYKSFATCDVVLCGVIDAIGFWNKNIKCFKDIKSTASNSPELYFNSYTISVQMMLYSYTIRALGWADHYIPAVIDGIFISKSGRGLRRSALLDYREDQINDLMSWFDEQVTNLVDRIEGRKEWRKNFTQCNTKFGMCQFFRVCSAQEPYRAGVINSLFDRREYNPLTFGIE